MPRVPFTMRELDLLARIYDRSSDLAAAYPHVLVGPGDDCAVISLPPPRGGEGRGGVGGNSDAPAPSAILLKVDQLIEGRHYTRGTSLDLIARKAIARAVSDIAAMAGTPTAALAAAALPKNFPQEPANQLFDAASRWARHFGCPLVGGDIASFETADSPLTLTITVIGTPHPTRGPVLRSTAKPGDHVYITGAIGGAFDKATGGGRHLTFEPRLREAAWLADTLGQDLHAMMDISDGLGLDAGRMAAAADLRIELTAAEIPLSQPSPVLEAIAVGEDYELLFTAAPDAVVPRACPETGTPLTRIGTCLPGQPACILQLHDGTSIDASGRGWEHH